MENDTSKDDSKSKKSLLHSGIILSIMTLMSRIMGLLREMTKASFLGTSMYADAFATSFMIPNLLRRLFAENAISVAFIPTFKKYLAKGDDEENHSETQEFLKATFTLVSFLTACVVVIGIIITPFLVPLFCKKPLDPDAADYAMQLQAWLLKKDEITILTRIMFPYLFVISIAAFFQGILNGCKIFAPSGFTPVLFNGIVILATYILSPYTENPARAMSIGVIAGGCIQALFRIFQKAHQAAVFQDRLIQVLHYDLSVADARRSVSVISGEFKHDFIHAAPGFELGPAGIAVQNMGQHVSADHLTHADLRETVGDRLQDLLHPVIEAFHIRLCAAFLEDFRRLVFRDAVRLIGHGGFRSGFGVPHQALESLIRQVVSRRAPLFPVDIGGHVRAASKDRTVQGEVHVFRIELPEFGFRDRQRIFPDTGFLQKLGQSVRSFLYRRHLIVLLWRS